MLRIRVRIKDDRKVLGMALEQVLRKGICWGNIGTMEKKMETTGIIGYILGYILGVYWGKGFRV